MFCEMAPSSAISSTKFHLDQSKRLQQKEPISSSWKTFRGDFVTFGVIAIVVNIVLYVVVVIGVG